jgi:cyanate permease
MPPFEIVHHNRPYQSKAQPWQPHQSLQQSLRARIAALLICGTGFVGAGLGPLLIGLLNDHATGNAALSLALVCGAGGILSASLLAKGCAPMRARGQTT